MLLNLQKRLEYEQLVARLEDIIENNVPFLKAENESFEPLYDDLSSVKQLLKELKDEGKKSLVEDFDMDALYDGKNQQPRRST